MEIALSGDAILTRTVSSCRDERFVAAIEPFREADFGFTHLESNILDYDEAGAYPSATAGGTWMRSPPSVAEDLSWLGIDAVSHASNHALDFSYGGLESTWDALDSAGVAHAGTGRTLGEARSPTYVETAAGRVALVSMTSSSPRSAVAGSRRPDFRGRPGTNPMRYRHVVDSATMSDLVELGRRLGWWMTKPSEGTLEVTRPGLHNSTVRYEEGEETTTRPHDRDLTENVRSVMDADARADYVIAHLHTHEFNPAGDIADSATFVRRTAEACLDAGADVFVAQGSHSPLRGMELYNGSPIFYDPGDLFRTADHVERLPADFYEQWADDLDTSTDAARPSEAFAARRASGDPSATAGYEGQISPSAGYLEGSVLGHVVPVCSFEDDSIVDITLHPGTFLEEPSTEMMGLPVQVDGEAGRKIVEDVAAKSAEFGTDITYDGEVGVVDL